MPCASISLNASASAEAGKASSVEPAVGVKVFHAKIGQLTLENDS
jgi:hypothetical protein